MIMTWEDDRNKPDDITEIVDRLMPEEIFMKYIFKNAMVLTMNNQEISESCDVLVEDDVISAIGSLNDEQKIMRG